MAQLNNIKGYWDASYGYDFNDEDMWEGQFILYDDGWFEGIVVDPKSPYLGDRFIFGAYFEDKCMKLLKATPLDISNPFIFDVKKEYESYKGMFSLIGLLGEQPYGVSLITTQVAEKQDDMEQLESRIENFKANMDEILQSFYGNTLRMRSQFVEIVRRNYEGIEFSKEEISEMRKTTDTISRDVAKGTVKQLKKIVNARQKPDTTTDDDIPF